MRKVLFMILMTTMIMLLASACSAAGPTKYSSQLSGTDAKATTQGTGDATFELSSDGTRLTYKVTVSNLSDIMMAHIHLAPKGQDGEIVAWLYPSAPPPKEIPGVSNGTLAEGTITSANLAGSLAGKPLSVLVDEIKKGNTYVNVHTKQYPAGEIRGQIK